jgi:2'-5' RNA ligase
MMKMPDQGQFALVAYVPDPLASFLYKMRRSLSEVPCPQPHVTILPPRPLRIPVESACRAVGEILQLQSQFEVELSQVCYFANTHTLYLDISDGAARIHALHDSLNCGDLFHQEEFTFRPHLTVSGLVDPLHLPAMLQRAEADWRANSCSPRFLISEVVCLLQQSGNPRGAWQRLWSVKLSTPPTAPNSTVTISATAQT